MNSSLGQDRFYRQNTEGIWQPQIGVGNREEYDSAGFNIILDMQERHFWYLGRHRFICSALRNQLCITNHTMSAVDLGGGCGGWIKYLLRHAPDICGELALADSSLQALRLAKSVVGERVGRYQVDLLNLGWENRWDLAFLLDVLEHIHHQLDALKQIYNALRPNGFLFITVPALQSFWSYNDELARHQRRYSPRDFRRLALQSGFILRKVCYFMFFLSPLYVVSRIIAPSLKHKSAEETRAFIVNTHRVPWTPVNYLLHQIFALETPLGLWCPFPWGTSLLGIFQKPR